MSKEFIFGPGIDAPPQPTPYRRTGSDPVSRSLRIYTLDPGVSRFDGAVATVDVPWEPVGPGPSGRIFSVHDVHQPSGRVFIPIDLDSYEVASGQGLGPSSTDPRFAQQMTYAVAMLTYERFRLALGRLPEFAPAVRRHAQGQLEIRPHFTLEDNAYYDPDQCALSFGYVRSSGRSAGSTQKGAYVYTSLSHDVIAHETTHAMLDGMRPYLMLPSNDDVAAFHEGFADLVALLMRFRYKDVVRCGLDASGGQLDAKLLTELARQWGRTDGDGRSPLRQVIVRGGEPDSDVPKKERYDRTKEIHDLGLVLVSAVFEAMNRVFERKTKTIRAIAAQAPGSHDEMLTLLTREVTDIAGQFLNIVIRAIDYCPPVDLTFGEFLRAIVTADKVTVPDDPHGYREALVLAFRRYGVTVPNVMDLSEESLMWRPPERELPPIPQLRFARLRHGVDPGSFGPEVERRRRARVLGTFIAEGRHRYFGVVPAGIHEGDRYEPFAIESVRTLRRLTPDDELNFHVVAEVTQRVRHKGRWHYGGSTIVIDEDGRIIFVVGKSVRNPERKQAVDDFLRRHPAYRTAHAQDTWSTGPLIRRFHR